jgi:hypothetical protein
MAISQSRFFSARNTDGWGVITETGDRLTPSNYASLALPQEGVFVAKVNALGPWSLRHINQPEVAVSELAQQVCRIGRPGTGLRAFESTNGRWGFFDANGRQRIEPRFLHATPGSMTDTLRFDDGQACVAFEIAGDSELGDTLALALIDKEGQTLVEPSSSFTAYGQSSFVILPNDGAEQEPPFGFDIRPFGKAPGPECRVPFRCADILGAFRFGYAPFAVDPKNDLERKHVEYFPSLEERKNLKWGLVGADGGVEFPAIYEDIRPFSEGLAPFKKNGLWGYLRKDGTTAIKPSFLEAEFFGDGSAACQSPDGKWGVIDESGSWVVEPSFEEIFSDFAPYD